MSGRRALWARTRRPTEPTRERRQLRSSTRCRMVVVGACGGDDLPHGRRHGVVPPQRLAGQQARVGLVHVVGCVGIVSSHHPQPPASLASGIRQRALPVGEELVFDAAIRVHRLKDVADGATRQGEGGKRDCLLTRHRQCPFRDRATSRAYWAGRIESVRHRFPRMSSLTAPATGVCTLAGHAVSRPTPALTRSTGCRCARR